MKEGDLRFVKDVSVYCYETRSLFRNFEIKSGAVMLIKAPNLMSIVWTVLTCYGVMFMTSGTLEFRMTGEA